MDYEKLFAAASGIRKKYAANPLTRADAIKVFADGVPEANPNNTPKNNYPVRAAKEAGAILIAGSDAPVLSNDPQPFVNMEMVVRSARRGLPRRADTHEQ